MEDSTSPLRAGVYGRESKGKQKSVDDQVALGRRLIDDRGWQHAGTYDDGSSASRFAKKAREDWQRLAADLAARKLDVLIVWEVTRGTREPVDGFTWLNLCRDHDVLIYVLSDDELYDPRKTRHYDMLGRAILDGAKESNTTSDRVLRGVRAAAKNGTPHGRVRYGYERRYNPETKAFAEERAHAEHAPVVREIVLRIGRADPIVHVVNDLNDRGVPSPTGGRWNRQTVRAIVRNVAYIGQRKHNDVTYPAVWPALVTEAEFRAANRVLDAPDRRRSKAGQARWLLSYLAVSNCGAPMQGHRPHDDTRKPSYRCLIDGCTAIGQWQLDEFVTRVVVARLSRDDAREMFLADDSEVSRAAEEAAALRAKLEEARASFVAVDGISAASLAEIERRLEPQIEAAERRRIAASVPAALVDLVTVDDVRRAWDGLPLAGRREVIKTLFQEIRVGLPTRRLGRWSADEDKLDAAAERVEITWRQA